MNNGQMEKLQKKRLVANPNVKITIRRKTRVGDEIMWNTCPKCGVRYEMDEYWGNYCCDYCLVEFCEQCYDEYICGGMCLDSCPDCNNKPWEKKY